MQFSTCDLYVVQPVKGPVSSTETVYASCEEAVAAAKEQSNMIVCGIQCEHLVMSLEDYIWDLRAWEREDARGPRYQQMCEQAF